MGGKRLRFTLSQAEFEVFSGLVHQRYEKSLKELAKVAPREAYEAIHLYCKSSRVGPDSKLKFDDRQVTAQQDGVAATTGCFRHFVEQEVPADPHGIDMVQVYVVTPKLLDFVRAKVRGEEPRRLVAEIQL